MKYFDDIDFNNDEMYPSRKLSQWRCLYRLIKEQPGKRKMSSFAELAECDKSTLSKAFKKTLTKKQAILDIPIAKRIAKKLKRPELVGKLCPEYREIEERPKIFEGTS